MIKKSTQGYKRNSPDRKAKKLRIPSNQITMEGVDFPVLGVDNLGNQQVMYPGENYVYEGAEYVDEMPLAKDGKWIQKAINPKHKGYCTPMTKSTCTPRRKALARTFKKHHGFHEDGGQISKNWLVGSEDGRMVAQAGASMPLEKDFVDPAAYHAALDAYMEQMRQNLSVPQVMQNKDLSKPAEMFGGTRNLEPLKDRLQTYTPPTGLQYTPSPNPFPNRDLSKPASMSPQKDRNRVNWGNTVLDALLMADILIPGDKIKDPVVRPGLSYNEHQYGTGSQAIAKHGKELPCLDCGGKMKKAQAGTRKPLVTNNPNDPRLKSYQDSLGLYQQTQKQLKNKKILAYRPEGKIENARVLLGKVNGVNNYTVKKLPLNLDKHKTKGIKPIGLYDIDNFIEKKEKVYHEGVLGEDVGYVPIVERYKKPVQPVIYEKPSQNPPGYDKKHPPIYLTNPKDPRINQYTEAGNQYLYKEQQRSTIKKGQPTYEDSMKLYKKYPPKYNQQDGRNFVPGKEIAEEYGQISWNNYVKNNTINGIKPIGSNMFLSGDFGKPVFKKPVGIPEPIEPKFKAPTRVPTDRPSMGNIEFNPNIPVPNMQRAEWDNTKPTKWSFTYPTGKYNEQKTQYFPDENSWKSFIQGQRGMSSQQGKDYGSATGYLEDGGELPTIYEEGGTYDLSDEEIKRLVAAGYQLKIK